MKKTLVATIVVLCIVALGLAILPTTRDEIHWLRASRSDETTSYESYVKTWPEGRHIAEARKRYDEHSWADAQSAHTVQSYEHYLQFHSSGKHVTEAKDNIESFHWQEAITDNLVYGFMRYIRLHRDGRHVAEARAKIESIQWKEATTANTVEGYERYLKLQRDGKYVVEAKDKIESLRWQEAITANTVIGFEKYLKLYIDGKHAAEAKNKIESIPWQEATSANTVLGFEKYIKLHSDGKHVAEAEAKISALRNDPAPYEAALQQGSEASLRQFIVDFHGHAKEAEAQKILRDITEGLDIIDLLKQKKIEVETQGNGIKSVRLRIRRLVTYHLTVRVPVGSYFVSARKSAQNMVSTAESKVRLTAASWVSVSVSAACANRSRDIPGNNDSFRIQRSPHQAELARLMPVLNKAQVPFAVRQAAVWIVTDNADYEDLGVLVGGSNWLRVEGFRQIKEQATARAMKICEEAGIDITRKRIWKDRKAVLQGLPDDEVKKWLKAKN
jgi:hypothetical protein